MTGQTTTPKSRVTATFEITGTGFAEGELDLSGRTPDEVAELIENQMVTHPSLCHQCAGEISDPEAGELTEFAVNGVFYEFRDGHWTRESE